LIPAHGEILRSVGALCPGEEGALCKFYTGRLCPTPLSGEAALYRPLEGVLPPHPLSQGGGALCGIF